MSPETYSTIGMLGESSLHAAIKRWYARPGDRLEVAVDGYFIDIQRQDLLIEIQTRNFANIKRKLHKLLQNHSVHLVHPIALEKWIIRLPTDSSSSPKRRKSPRRGRFEYIFNELVRIPDLIKYPRFTLEVLLTREEELRVLDGKGSWRRKGWSISDHILLEIVDHLHLRTPADFVQLLPESLPSPFTTRDLAEQKSMPRRLAQKMAYCLRNMGVVQIVGKSGAENQYSLSLPET